MKDIPIMPFFLEEVHAASQKKTWRLKLANEPRFSLKGKMRIRLLKKTTLMVFCCTCDCIHFDWSKGHIKSLMDSPSKVSWLQSIFVELDTGCNWERIRSSCCSSFVGPGTIEIGCFCKWYPQVQCVGFPDRSLWIFCGGGRGQHFWFKLKIMCRLSTYIEFRTCFYSF